MNWLQRAAGIPVLLPYHHLVSDEPVPHVRHLFPYKNKKQFISDLDFLLRHFHPQDPGSLIGAMRDGKVPRPGSFLLSFDDGLRECYDVIAPILLSKGVPAFFFLNPAFLDNRELFYRSKMSLVLEQIEMRPPSRALGHQIRLALGLMPDNPAGLHRAILEVDYQRREVADLLGTYLEISFPDYLRQRQPYLSSEQVRYLHTRGFGIGAHSLDHPNFRLLSLDEQLRQTRQSCDWIRRHFSPDYTIFSFPHEDAGVSQNFFDALADDLPRIDLLLGTQNQNMEWNNRVMHRFNAERPAYPIEGLVKGILLYHLRKRSVLRKGAHQSL